MADVSSNPYRLHPDSILAPSRTLFLHSQAHRSGTDPDQHDRGLGRTHRNHRSGRRKRVHAALVDPGELRRQDRGPERVGTLRHRDGRDHPGGLRQASRTSDGGFPGWFGCGSWWFCWDSSPSEACWEASRKFSTPGSRSLLQRLVVDPQPLHGRTAGRRPLLSDRAGSDSHGGDLYRTDSRLCLSAFPGPAILLLGQSSGRPLLSSPAGAD